MMSREEWRQQFERFKENQRLNAIPDGTIRHSNSRYAADATFEDKLTDEDKALLESLKVRV